MAFFKKENYPSYILLGFLLLASFIFFGKSLNNEYALDDGIVIEKNELVHKGYAGIGDILTKDAYYSFYKMLGSKGQLQGGRYRPLSIVTYAMEYEWMGYKKGGTISYTGTDGKEYKGKVNKVNINGEVNFKTPEGANGAIGFTMTHEFKKLARFQHFVNVLLYGFSACVLFYFLSAFLLADWKYKEYWAFFISLVFLMHPIHSEVVANIKSRDEILSFLFIILSLIAAGRYLKKNNFISGFLLAFFFFTAMLAKEYAVVLFFILPVWVYTRDKKPDLKKIVFSVLPLLLAFIPYLFLRVSSGKMFVEGEVKKDVLNDPYMFAVGAQQMATQVYILLKYLWLQIVPYPLASDYSYNTITYRSFSSPEVWLSLVLHLAIIGGTFYAIIRKNFILSFAGLFYLLNLALVTNFIFNIGATMGERLVFNASLGLIIAFFYLVYLLTKKLKGKGALYMAGGISLLIALPFFKIDQDRSAAWKNDYTLAVTDVKTNPNSALLNANAAAYTINLSETSEYILQAPEMVKEAEGYIQKALEVHPVMANGWANYCVIEFKLKKYDEAEKALYKTIEILPGQPNIPRLRAILSTEYVNIAFERSKENKKEECLNWLYRAKKVDPNSAEPYYNLGGFYLSIGYPDSAETYFTKTLQLNPSHPGAIAGMQAMGKR